MNSGEVHAGLVGATRGHRKHGYVGDVVNVAARLQAAAPVGGVLIGEDTFRELGPRAVVEPLPPLHVKGKREPVSSFSSSAWRRPSAFKAASIGRCAASRRSAPYTRWMSDGAAEAPGRVERLARRPLEHVGGVVRGVARALPRAIEDMFTDRCTQYAAAIAYRVLFSLFPLTIALVSVFGLVLQDDELRQQVIDELIDLLPVSQSGQGNIQQSIDQIATPLSAIGLISLVALLWGASGMMASIRLGLEAALKVDRGRPAARAKLVDFILVAAAGVLVLVIVGLSAFGAFFSKLVDRFTEWAGIATPSGLLLRDGLQLVAIGVTVLLLYRFVPARKLRRRGALAGAILTAVGIWGVDEGARDRVLRLLALQPHLRLARRRHDVPLLRLRRRVDPAPRRRVRVRVVAAARAARAAAPRAGHRRRPRPLRPPRGRGDAAPSEEPARRP